MSRLGLVALLVAAVALAVGDRVVASATQLYPIDLRVVGGEYAWQTTDSFELRWERPPIAEQGFPITAVGYRVRDAGGTVVVPETRLGGDRTRLDIQLQPLPGAYTVEVWLEGADGERGPEVSTELRYDHTRPGTVRLSSPAAWIDGTTTPQISILPPLDPQPVSGIGGYAVSIDRGGETWPCAARNWCRAAEIDLRSPETTLPLGTLPEGVSVVRAVGVSGAGIPSAETAATLVHVDATRPEVALTGAPAGWSDGPVPLVAKASDALSGMVPDGPNGPWTAIALDRDVPRAELGDSAGLTVLGEGIHQVDVYARDAAGNGGDRPARTVIVSIDESPPGVSFAATQDPADPERIEATVADALAGPDLDRGSIAFREAETSQTWLALPTTATAGRLVARWDSEAYREGVYEFRATGFDAAGNVGSSNLRANHTRMVLVNPLKRAARLQAGFAGTRRPAARGLPYGSRPAYRGRLTSASGEPLGGQVVRIVESFDPGGTAPERSTQVLTAADGSFALRLLPGPSREVEARFGGTRTLGRAAGGRSQLRVLGELTIRASARTARVGGAPVVFSGRVGRLGARLPAGGLPVELQFRVAGGDWAEFRTVQSDARGRFRYPYAFSDDDSRGVRFQFRAYVNRGDWPYEPAASNGVTVKGR